MSDSEICTPPEIVDIANTATMELLPIKSQHRYQDEYRKFCEWKLTKQIGHISENVLLAYFSEKSKSLSPTTLWSIYSMLKTMIAITDNVEIKGFVKLIAFLKRKNEGYTPKKSQTYTREQIDQFILEAIDNDYLLMKIVLIVGVAGACRCDELKNLRIIDVKNENQIIIVNLPTTKTKQTRTFTIVSPLHVELVHKYQNLRPAQTSHNTFFVSFRKGKCSVQPVGINTFSKIPYRIANYLKLDNPTGFTGHCFRRSSASLLVDAGGDLLTLKKHGGWRSSTVAESYVDESITRKNSVAGKIFTPTPSTSQPLIIPSPRSTESPTISILKSPSKATNIDATNNMQIINNPAVSKPGHINISHNTSCTINIIFNK